MGCGRIRESLSARLDGEDERDDPVTIDAHLESCQACQDWFDDAAAVTRLIRTAPAPAPAGLPEAVLAAAPGPGRARLATALRMVLAGLGVAQLALGIGQIATLQAALGQIHHDTLLTGTTPGHLWHESAAWNVAVGAGFLWVAARRGRPGAIVAILTAFVGLLALLNIGDLMSGRVEVTHLTTHGLVLTGYLIVLALSRPALDLDRPPRPGGRAMPWARVRAELAGAEPEEATDVGRSGDDRSRHLPAASTATGPPAARRRAA